MLLVNSLRGSARGSIWGFALTVCVALLFLLFPSFPGLFDVSLCVVWLCAAEGNLQVVTGNLSFPVFPLPSLSPLFLHAIEKCLYACLIFGNVVLSWLGVILLATAFSSPGQQQNVNEDALNEPAFAALSLLAGRANMFPVGERPRLYAQTMCLASG